MAYRTRNPRKTDVPIVDEQKLLVSPWLISSCSNRTEAHRILQSCPSIENGNFLVRTSENSNAKYTITLWFNGTSTHIRIQQLPTGKYRFEYESKSKIPMPEFSTLDSLIEFYTNNPMKLVGFCEGSIKLKYNAEIFDQYNRSLGGIVTYGP